MLKPQDYLILLKYLANPDQSWLQRDLSKILHISLSEVNAGIKRLINAKVFRKDVDGNIAPNLTAAKELLIHGVKYQFPGYLGEFTRGTPTAYAAPIFADKIVHGNDPVPVWPFAIGDVKGIALAPIHHSIPKTLCEYPDQTLYDLVALVDAIRIGRARERKLAVEMLGKNLDNDM